tara:strand:- start:2433 stop:2924 length:492 start_codon:yes stop_codon:yes gene_type:complete
MLFGVVSDTHNNYKNIEKIISLFNEKTLEFVIHTGDISNTKALEKFSRLNCSLYGVFGNNDRTEQGLAEVAKKNCFQIVNPPLQLNKGGKKIAVFHEPNDIDEYLLKNIDIDIVLHGHTHRFREEIVNKVLIYNPGESAGMLKEKNAIGIVDLNSLSAERIFF